MAAKLRYADTHDLTFGGVTAYSDVIYRANCAFDPYATGVGHQPRGFDQYMTMYDHFTVVGSKISLTFTNESNAAPVSMPIACAVVLSDNNVPITTSWADIMERGDIAKTTIAHPEGSNAVRSIKKGFGAKKFFSVSNVMDNANLKGDVVTSPQEQAYFHILNAVPAIASDRGVNVQVVIDYIVVFSEPKQPPQS